MDDQKKSINYQVQRIVRDEIAQIAYPTIVTIRKVYSDDYVDIEGDFGLLRHIYSITEHDVGDKTLLIFADGDFNYGMVI